MFRESFSFLLDVSVNHGLPRSCVLGNLNRNVKWLKTFGQTTKGTDI